MTTTAMTETERVLRQEFPDPDSQAWITHFGEITDLLQAAAAIAWSAGVSLDDYLQCASLAWPTGASITPPPDPTAVTTAAALAGDQPGQGAPFDEVAVSRG